MALKRRAVKDDSHEGGESRDQESKKLNVSSCGHPAVGSSRRLKLISLIALILWLGGLHLNILIVSTSLWNVREVWAMSLLIAWVALIFVPIRGTHPWGLMLSRFILDHAPRHFPLTVEIEDRSAFDPNISYVIGLEPHSVFPLSLVGLSGHHKFLPFQKIKALASSAVFMTPIVRHLWSWLGLAPCTRHNFHRLLQEGTTCVIIPGGVQECLFMERNEEVVFLKKRYGFVRIAMETGSPLVPAFAFGQSRTYKWWKPQGLWFEQISRTIGFAPIMFWGMFGTPVPFPEPMHCIIGRPIHFPKILNPSREEIADVHAKFVTAMEELFEKHKTNLGYKDLTLRIY